MPYPNEHACRLREPGAFQKDSFRRVTRNHKGKQYSIIMGKLKGKSSMTEQAYRYPRGSWSASDARAHCTSHNGKSFEPASGKEAARAALRGAIQPTIRTATFDGREHVVFNVVALVQGVLHASNSSTPELVLAEEFSKVPQGWNGRPVVLNHPELAGEKVSANEPRILEQYQMGEVFHTEVRGDKLVMEAWVDPARAEKVGDAALQLLERVKEGKRPVEVSVGVFVQTEEKAGIYQGERYAGIWREIVPDHLALLPEGTVGACSVEMGCGAPRAAEEKKMAKSLKERFQEIVARFRPAEEMSDADTRNALHDSLFASEPAFIGIVEVYPDSKEVIYAVAPEGVPQFYRRKYEVDDASNVSLGEAEEVKQVTRYEPVAAAAAPPAQEGTTTASAAPCGCDGPGSTTAPTSTSKEDEMDKKARVAAIIASGKTCFTAAEAPLLEAADEAIIKHLEDSVQKQVDDKKKDETTPTPAATTTAQPEPLTEEKVLTAFPDLKKIVEGHRTAEAAKKAELVAKLKDAAKAAYTEDELKAMPVDQLEKLASLTVKPQKDFTPLSPRDASAERAQTSDELRAAMRDRLKARSA